MHKGRSKQTYSLEYVIGTLPELTKKNTMNLADSGWLQREQAVRGSCPGEESAVANREGSVSCSLDFFGYFLIMQKVTLKIFGQAKKYEEIIFYDNVKSNIKDLLYKQKVRRKCFMYFSLDGNVPKDQGCTKFY